MAAPETVTTKDLTGVFLMNKEESGEFDPILQLQGIGWLVRKAIGIMPVQLNIKQYTDDKGVVNIDIEQPGAAGIKGTTELRTLNGEWRDHEDHIFGAVRGKNSWSKISDYKDDSEEDKFLKSGWDKATEEGDLIEGFVESIKNGWTARQVWGFKDVKGVRKYCRNVVVRKGDQVKMVTLIYDYKGPLPN
jgi:hypothetical protein